MDYQTISVSIESGVASLCLNRPQALNSFTVEMHSELRDALKSISTDDDVRAVLLTGEGRGFCAGQDLNERNLSSQHGDSKDVDLGISIEENYNPLILSITSLAKPVVCAVNGVAAGAGVSLVLACDIVLAAKSASFIQSFAKIGLVPDSGGTWHLPRALTLPRAKALAMLGDKLSAQQAAEWGMIWRCVDDQQLMSEAESTARYLAQQPTQALAAIKRMLTDASMTTLAEQLEIEKNTMRRLGCSADYAEGVAAFLAKRKPNFSGD